MADIDPKDFGLTAEPNPEDFGLTPAAPEKPIGSLESTIIEPALAIGSQMLGQSVAGYKGIANLAKSGYAKLTYDPDRPLIGSLMEATQSMEGVPQSFTIDPKTQSGELATKAASVPLNAIGTALDWMGQKAGGLAEKAGAPPEASTLAYMSPYLIPIPKSIPIIGKPLAGESAALRGPAFLPAKIPTGLKIATQSAIDWASKVKDAAENAVRTIAGTPKINLLDENGRVSQDVHKALSDVDKSDYDKAVSDALKKSGLITTKDQADRVDLFARNNIPLNKAYITQSTDDWRNLSELKKSSNGITEQEAQTHAQLHKNAQDKINSLGGNTDDNLSTGQSAQDAALGFMKKTDDAISSAYEKRKAEVGDKQDISLNAFVKNLKDNYASDFKSGGTLSSIKGQLMKDGIIDADFNIKGKLSAQQAEDVRQMLNQHYINTPTTGSERFANNIVSNLKAAHDFDVLRSTGSDAFKEARDMAAQQKQAIQRTKVSKYDVSGDSLVQKIINNKIPADQIVASIRNAGPKDLEAMKRFYNEDAGPEGVQAWKNIQAQLAREAYQQSIDRTGKVEGGLSVMNGDKFYNYFNTMKSRGTLPIAFDMDMQQFIKDQKDLASAMKPKGNVAQGEGPTSFAVHAAKEELKKIPLIGTIPEKIAREKSLNEMMNPLQKPQKELGTLWLKQK